MVDISSNFLLFFPILGFPYKNSSSGVVSDSMCFIYLGGFLFIPYLKYNLNGLSLLRNSILIVLDLRLSLHATLEPSSLKT